MNIEQLLAHIRELQARRKQLLASLRLPPEALPGSLAESRGRCGSSGCHCHQDGGHPSWTLTFMVDRKKRVEHIPTEWVDAAQEKVAQGKAYKEGVAELMALNARLLILERRARKQREAERKRRIAR